MCNHEYKIPSFGMPEKCHLNVILQKNCEFPGQYSKLPLDANGLCVFHSKDNNWKRKKINAQYWQLLTDILKNNDEELLDYREIRFIKSTDEEFLSWYEFNGRMNFSGCHFENKVVIHHSKFLNAIFFDECEFIGGLHLEDSTFKESFTAIGGCSIYEECYMRSCTFESFFDINNAKIYCPANVIDVTFNQYTIWDKCFFTCKDVTISYFNFTSKGYLTFNDTSFSTQVQFDNCNIQGDTVFRDTIFEREIYFQNLIVQANLKFIGSDIKSRIFTNEVNFDLSEENFIDSGQIIFENANLIQLNAETKSKLLFLQNNRRIILGEGTLVYRISMQKKYPFSQINTVFIQSLVTTIKQYFEMCLGKHYEFSLGKLQNELVLTVFTDDFFNSEDLIAAEAGAVEKLKANKTSTNSYLEEILVENYRKAVSDTFRAFLKSKASEKIISDFLGNTPINLKINKAQIAQLHSTDTKIQSVTGSSLYINRLQSLDNSPCFNLKDDQFRALQDQLSVINNSELEIIHSIVERIEKNQISKDRLGQFLVSTGVSVANNISGSILFMILHAILMK